MALNTDNCRVGDFILFVFLIFARIKAKADSEVQESSELGDLFVTGI